MYMWIQLQIASSWCMTSMKKNVGKSWMQKQAGLFTRKRKIQQVSNMAQQF